jgi:hypothetical protein
MADWKIIGGPIGVPPENKDAQVFRFRYKRGEAEQYVWISISDTAMGMSVEAMPPHLPPIVATKGQALVEQRLTSGENPKRLTVDSSGNVSEEPVQNEL